MKNLVLTSLLLSSIAGFNAEAATTTYAFTGGAPQQFTTGYIDGQQTSAAIPASILAAHSMLGSFTVDLDPALQTTVNTADTHKLIFSGVSVFFTTDTNWGPITLSQATVTVDDEMWNPDVFLVSAQNSFTQGNYQYTYTFNLRLESSPVLGFKPLPLSLLTVAQLNSGYFSNQGGLNFYAQRKDISGSCTANCSVSWGTQNGGSGVTISEGVAPVPLPGAIWLFLSALAAPLTASVRRARKASSRNH